MTFVYGSSALEVTDRHRHRAAGRRSGLAPSIDLDVERRRGEGLPDRAEIAASWRECLASGLDPQRLAVHRDDTEDRTDEVIRSGRRVIERLAEDLAGTGVSVKINKRYVGRSVSLSNSTAAFSARSLLKA